MVTRFEIGPSRLFSSLWCSHYMESNPSGPYPSNEQKIQIVNLSVYRILEIGRIDHYPRETVIS